jgi:cold shock CspA family protein
MSEVEINSEFCFNTNKKITIEIAHNAFKNYADKLSEALQLNESTIPIIVDTNVLLAYYGLSQIEKDKLLEFLNNNKDRIFLTFQIEKEFLKNRIKVIDRDFFDPLNAIQSEFLHTYKKIKDYFNNFIDKNRKILSKDYASIWDSLSKKQNQLNQFLEDEQILSDTIAEAIKKTTTNYKNIYVVDKLLEVCAKLTVTSPLSDEEVKFIEEQYDALWKEYEIVISDEKKRRKTVFPGCGDKKNKEEYPYGDFIIFHEILKFMAHGKNGSDNRDVIFLTHDKNKYDWMHRDLSPITHYIEKVFLVTNKSLFIIDANKLLEISFENIYKNNQIQENDSVIRESTIITLNLEKQWGFISSRAGNLYFNPDFMQHEEEFYLLTQNDVVQYQIGKNQKGEDIAINVKKVVYSFEDKTPSIIQNTISSPVFKSTICSLDKEKGYGFILAHPENLYFHSTYLKDPTVFCALECGSTVEYIVGLNEFGEDIARLVREVPLPQNESKSFE